ncbi:MAG: NYN domain-containing protein [Candidatus Limnocylindrales bacterium]
MPVPNGVLRVWVFIDAQNLYRDTRRAFFADTDPSQHGQIDPVKFATLLTEMGTAPPDQTRVLEECRLYTGLPSPDREPKSNAAMLRQKASWEASGAKVYTRPLRYPRAWPAQPAEEKGVDVELAVDLVFNAARQNFDVGIVASTDTDLVPALQAVCNLHRAWGRPRVEVVAWKALKKRLRVPDVPIWCHLLEERHYQMVHDDTRYGTAS